MSLDDELGLTFMDEFMGDSMEYYPPQFAKLTKKEREYVLSMAIRESHLPTPLKFSPLTHCALCGKMFPSIAVSVRNGVPLNFTINHACFWDEPVCDCENKQ